MPGVSRTRVSQEPRLTTDQVAELCKVSSAQVKLDVKKGLLPHPPRGRGATWEPWAARRAVYLYRLRRRGAAGDILDVLLFLRDGWGWGQVKPLVRTGLESVIKLTMSPVESRYRVKPPTAKTVQANAIDYVDGPNDEARDLEANSMLPTWLGLLFGQPPTDAFSVSQVGRIGGMVGLDAVDPALYAQAMAAMSFQSEALLGAIDRATDDDVRVAHKNAGIHVKMIRRAMHHALKRKSQPWLPALRSSNPLTLFGISWPEEKRQMSWFDTFLRHLHGQPRRAEIFACAMFAGDVIVAYNLRVNSELQRMPERLGSAPEALSLITT